MARLTLSGAFLIAATYGLARFGLGLFVPELRIDLGLSSVAVGLVLAASFAGYVVALLAAGQLLDRFGPRAVATMAGLCATFGTVGVAAAPTAGVLGVAAVVGGLSTGWASTSLAAAVEAQLSPHHRATSQTSINAGTSIGLIVAAAAAVLAGSAWQHAWLAFALLAVTATAWVSVTVDRSHDDHVRGGRRRPFIHRVSRPLGASALLLGVSSATFWGFAREQLVSVASLPAGSGRATWAALGVGGFAGATAGAAVRRFGMAPALAVVWAVFAIGHALLANGPIPLATALASVAAIGAGYMALTGLTIVWAVRESPEQPGAAVATAFLLLAVAQTVASPLAGAIVDQAGLAAAFNLAALVSAAGCLIRPSAGSTDRARTVAALVEQPTAGGLAPASRTADSPVGVDGRGQPAPCCLTNEE